LRWEVLTEALFRCQCDVCKGEKKVWPRATVVDHIVPHRGSWDAFHDKSNCQALAVRCHNRKTAGEVNARRR
jgi:5-methylcytosine-specific restriction protein A